MTTQPTPPALAIAPVSVRFQTRGGVVKTFSTDSSARLFLRLADAGRRGERVGVLTESDRILEQDSLLALNAYLRTAKAPRGGVFPFTRLGLRGDTSRHGWEMFKGYLALAFV